MKVTKVELEGRPGCTALLRPDLAGVYATVELRTPAGEELFVVTAETGSLEVKFRLVVQQQGRRLDHGDDTSQCRGEHKLPRT